MKTYVKDSIVGSIFAQVITLFVNLYGLSLSLKPSDQVLQEILGVETIVQIIELGFYGWYANHVSTQIVDVAKYRYYDWALTTPMMLFSTMAFYSYLKSKEDEEKEDKQPSLGLLNFFKQHWVTILTVFFFNAFMLLFGFFAEIGIMSSLWSSILGYGALLGSFGLVYNKFVTQVAFAKQGIFWFMFFFWSLYGIAALFENHAKNVSYNILDVFAKNFYGLYLSWFIFGLKN